MTLRSDHSGPSAPVSSGVVLSPLVVSRVDLRAIATHRARLCCIVDVASERALESDVALHRCVCAAEALIASLERFVGALGPSRRAERGVTRYVDAVHAWLGALLASWGDLIARGARLSLSSIALMRSRAAEERFEHLHRAVAASPAFRQIGRTLHGDVVWLCCELGLAFE